MLNGIYLLQYFVCYCNDNKSSFFTLTYTENGSTEKEKSGKLCNDGEKNAKRVR